MKHREKRIQIDADNWIKDTRRERNGWLALLAAKRGWTVTEYLRKVAEADSAAGIHMEEWKKKVRQGYRDWYKFLDENIKK